MYPHQTVDERTDTDGPYFHDADQPSDHGTGLKCSIRVVCLRPRPGRGGVVSTMHLRLDTRIDMLPDSSSLGEKSSFNFDTCTGNTRPKYVWKEWRVTQSISIYIV